MLRISFNGTTPLLLSGIASFVLGAIVVMGWFIENTSLIQVRPSFVPMQFNTALGFIIAGILWILSTSNYLKLTKALAILLFGLGTLSLTQYLGGFDLGIDQLLMQHYITTQTSHPGRMAPNTALCFALIALCVVMKINPLFDSKTKWCQIIPTVLLIVLSIVPFAGYLLDAEAAYGWLNYTRMAIHTSFGFVVLGMGYLIPLLGTIERQRLGFLVPSLAIGMIFISLGLAIQKRETNEIKLEIKKEATIVKKAYSLEVEQLKLALQRMAKRQATYPKSFADEIWLADAKNFYENFNSMLAIKWMDRDGFVRLVYPKLDNVNSLGSHSISQEKIVTVVEQATLSQEFQFSKAIDLENGTKVILLVSPSYVSNDVLYGFTLVVLNLNQYFQTTMKKISNDSFNSYMSYKQETIAKHLIDEKLREKLTLEQYRQSFEVANMGRDWTIDFVPTSGFLDSQYSGFSEVILLLGFILSVASGISFFYYSRHKRQLFIVNKKKNELYEANLKVEKTLEDKKLFFANINHELRTPLNGILGITEMIIAERQEINKSDF